MGRVIVSALLEKDGKYLLVQERKGKNYGKWNIPAGHLEPNETIFEGAIREVSEETGYKTKLTGIIEIFNRKSIDDVVMGIVFKAEIIEGELNFNNEELLDVKWFSHEVIIDMQEELRAPGTLFRSIAALQQNNIKPLDLIKVINYEGRSID